MKGIRKKNEIIVLTCIILRYEIFHKDKMKGNFAI